MKVRHIDALHLIAGRIDRIAVADLVRSIAEQDAQQFRNQHPAYRADIASETRRALVAMWVDPIVRERYTAFVRAMVYGEPVEFRAALATVADLVDIVWPGR